MTTFMAFVRLSRLHFLVGGFIMFALGARLAGVDGWVPYLLGQMMLTASQLTAHYVNEYADLEADKAITNRTQFSGGSGVLVSGDLSPSVALNAAFVTTAVCVGASVVVAFISPAAAILGLLALSVSWAYSMPPVRLVGTGWGELATSLTVAGLYPAIGVLANGGASVATVLWVCAVLIPVQFAMLLAFELPDLESDDRAGKRVLGVRIGYRNTTYLMLVLVVAAVLAGILGFMFDLIATDIVLGAAVAIPLGLAMLIGAHRRGYKLTTLAAVSSFAVCGLTMAVGA